MKKLIVMLCGVALIMIGATGCGTHTEVEIPEKTVEEYYADEAINTTNDLIEELEALYETHPELWENS